jgi:hypothetical protein
MTGMVRKALTIAAGLAVVASVASAGVPDPRNSTTDPVIVGNTSGSSMFGGYDVVVKDVNNTGLVGRTVSLDFSATVVRVMKQAFQNAGTTVNATTCVASRVTGAGGAVNFALRFGKFVNTNSVAVSCDGVPLANVMARSTDNDGTDGNTFITDFTAMSQAYNTATPAFDFDNDGVAFIVDYTRLAQEYNVANLGAASYCP